MSEGGTAWELSDAIRLMGEAVAAGDAEQIAIAMRRHAEALSNQSLTVLVPTLEKTLRSVVKPAVEQLTTAIDGIKAHQDQRFGYILGQLETEFKTNARWRDEWANEIRTLGAGVHQLEVRIEELDSRHASQWRLVMNRLDTDQQRLDRKRREIDEIKGEISALKDRLSKIEARGDGG